MLEPDEPIRCIMSLNRGTFFLCHPEPDPWQPTAPCGAGGQSVSGAHGVADRPEQERATAAARVQTQTGRDRVQGNGPAASELELSLSSRRGDVYPEYFLLVTPNIY